MKCCIVKEIKSHVPIRTVCALLSVETRAQIRAEVGCLVEMLCTLESSVVIFDHDLQTVFV